MTTDVTINTGEVNQINTDEKGNLNLLGMQLKISDIIGDKIVDQFMVTISPEQMETITKVLFDEVFKVYDKEEYDADSQKYKKVCCTEFKTQKRVETGSYYSSRTQYEDTPIYARAKATILHKYSEMISAKVEEYLNSDEYKAKAEEIAKDIINYAIEGYKEDIIKGIYERLVLPVTTPNYDYYRTQDIAKTATEEVMSQNRYYENGNSIQSY